MHLFIWQFAVLSQFADLITKHTFSLHFAACQVLLHGHTPLTHIHSSTLRVHNYFTF